ncbi:MAG: hypothetical protein ABJK18_05210 [Marinobacter sp.]
MRREIDRFTCKTDEGEKFTVVVTEDVLTFRDKSTGVGEQIPGGKRQLRLSNGLCLTRISDKPDTFEIIQSGKIIVRSDIA